MPKRRITPKAAFKRLQTIDPHAEVAWDEKTTAAKHVRGNLSGPKTGEPEAIAQQFLDANKDLLAMNAPEKELQLKGVNTDARGNKHIRYQQMYKGLPVFARDLLVHLTGENAIRGMDSNYIPGIDLPTEPKITGGKAAEIMVKHAPGNKLPPGGEPVLLILVHEGKAHLAWHMTVGGTDRALDGSEMPARWAYFVDAQDGEVIWRYNNLQTHGRTRGTGTGKYAGSVTLNTLHDHAESDWDLEDRWLPSTARVYTHDANGYLDPFTLCPPEPVSPVSEDDDNNWSAADQGPEADCHLYTRMVFDYFLLMHGRNSYDNAGADLHIHAHVGTNFNNAFWNGSCVQVGDGDGTDFDNFCTLDIIAHEWTHAVTEYTAGLIYEGEPGALNESMSDVFAALIDGNWLHGEDNWLNTAEAPAGRNLADPTNGGRYDTTDPIGSVEHGHQPDHYDDRYNPPRPWDSTNDKGGVHVNSGIMNKAAYLIATGGTHRGIRICDGLGREVLGRLYFNALTSHLLNNSDFADMRQAVLDSLDDLFSGDPRYDRWRVSINNAFAAVGIGTAQPCPLPCLIAPIIAYQPAPIITCPPGPIITWQPAPIIACPPAPIITGPSAPIITCPSGPIIIGCLPGPDPAPFTPKMKELEPMAKKTTAKRVSVRKTVSKKTTRGRSR